MASKFNDRLEELAIVGAAIANHRDEIVDKVIESSFLNRSFAELDTDTMIYVFSNYNGLISHLNSKGCDLESRQGRGKVAAILPYNGPLMTGALAIAGSYIWEENSLQVKPATESLPIFELIAEILHDEGMDSILENYDGSAVVSNESGKKFLKNAINTESGITVLEHYGHDSMITPEMEKELMENPNILYILEGPGKNRFVATQTTPDLAKCASVITQGALLNSGQSCMAGEIFDVHSSIYEEIVAQVVGEASSYAVGNPKDASNSISPLKGGLAKRIKHQIDEAISRGAKVEYMTQTAHGASGEMDFYQDKPESFHLIPFEGKPGMFYVPVTVLSNVSDDMSIRHDETFGPVIPLGRYDKVEDIKRGIESARYGLEMTLFGKNLEKTEQELLHIARENSGHIFMNEFFLAEGQYNILLDPWGGEKYSRFSLQGTTSNGKPALLKTQTGPGYIVLDFSQPPE